MRKRITNENILWNRIFGLSKGDKVKIRIISCRKELIELYNNKEGIVVDKGVNMVFPYTVKVKGVGTNVFSVEELILLEKGK